MVKQLDENNAGPDHVGIRLWGAYEAWKAEFVSAMVEAGHAWFTPSRATLLGFVPRTGLRQSDLIARMGISKQAVQQLVDGLEGEGVLERIADPDDKRGRILRHTEKGRAALDDADRIKAEIETRYRARLGEERFRLLVEALGEVRRGG
ncbi:MAG: MarR family transcriptional regulator [Ahrensia sp.]|nr:MarR family transcriptional regulator [Ahrensia sp.]|tara:strand:+ start:3866 stop:4312 length:447 start_codon:yes stop_codon:yes gene_type:complete